MKKKYVWQPVYSGCSEQAVKEPESQFIPAPFSCSLKGYRLLSRETACDVPAGTVKTGSIAFQEGELVLQLDGNALPMNERFCEKRFKLSENAKFESYDGPIAKIERLITSLVEAENGKSTGSDSICYDFVFYKELPLVQIFACFDPDTRQEFLPPNLFSFTFPEGKYTEVTGGLPQFQMNLKEKCMYTFDDYLAVRAGNEQYAFIGGQPRIAVADGVGTISPDVYAEMVVRDRMEYGENHWDIPEYGPERPFSATLVYGAAAASPTDWLDCIPAIVHEESGRQADVTLRAGDLEVGFGNNGQGVELLSIYDKKAGRFLLQGGANALFTAGLRAPQTKEDILLSSAKGWGQVHIIPSDKLCSLVFSNHCEAEGITVMITALCDEEKSRISWEMDIQNQSKIYAVFEADYPRLCYDSDRDTVLLTSYGSGELREKLGTAAIHILQSYPSFNESMQFDALYQASTRRGIYYAIHDGQGYHKRFVAEKQGCDSRIRLNASMPFENLTKAGNSGHLAGSTVWQLFDGDWFDASMIYRDFVLNEAKWIPEITEKGRTDVPEWFLKCPHWWRVFVTPEDDWWQDVITASEDLGVPCTAHTYRWHQNPYDNDYPHYFPAKLEYLNNIHYLQEKGIHVMPYINGRLWDTRDRGMEDYQFTSLAKPWATKVLDGEPYTETYAAREKDGSLVKNSIMCPTSALWQETQTDLVNRLFHEVGVDAVYIDQVAAAKPILCVDEGHEHPTGGGNWWVQAYGRLLQHIHRITPKDKALCSECTGEAYMKNFTSFLSWNWVRAGQVPAFSVVYAGYVPMVGRNYGGEANDEQNNTFRIFCVQSLLFGEQMGWMVAQKYLQNPYKAFYRTCVQTRYRFNEYFYAGQMLRPPFVTNNQKPLIGYDGPTAEGNLLVHPAVSGGIWKRMSDGKRLLLLVNASDAEAETTVRIEGYTGTLRLTGGVNADLKLAENGASLKLPPLSVVAAEY